MMYVFIIHTLNQTEELPVGTRDIIKKLQDYTSSLRPWDSGRKHLRSRAT